MILKDTKVGTDTIRQINTWRCTWLKVIFTTCLLNTHTFLTSNTHTDSEITTGISTWVPVVSQVPSPVRTCAWNEDSARMFLTWSNIAVALRQEPVTEAESALPLTGWSVRLMPMRKRSSATKRLMHKFLWIVLRSLCSPRKKQKVKMQIRRQTSESRMPTHVMKSRSKSWTASLCWW